MNKIFFSFLSIISVIISNSQNVGIRISSPYYPLTVGTNANGTGIVQKGNGVEIGLSSVGSAGSLETLTNHNLHFATNNR